MFSPMPPPARAALPSWLRRTPLGELYRDCQAEDDLVDYPAYTYRDSIYGGSVWDMVEYNGHLYVSICTGTEENAPDDNTMQSFAIVRGDEKRRRHLYLAPLIGGHREEGDASNIFGMDPERTRSGAAT